MDAVKYLKAKTRMTDGCQIDCGNCPFNCDGECSELQRLYPKKAVEIVENWLKQNSKTYMQDFLEKFPNARLTRDGRLSVCRDNVYSGDESCDGKHCLSCWSELMEV